MLKIYLKVVLTALLVVLFFTIVPPMVSYNSWDVVIIGFIAVISALPIGFILGKSILIDIKNISKKEKDNV